MEKSSEISTSRSILGSDEFYDLEEEVTEECEEFEDSEGFEDLDSQFFPRLQLQPRMKF